MQPVNEAKTYDHVYYVESASQDFRVNPIAIKPTFKEDGSVEWQDAPNHARCFKTSKVNFTYSPSTSLTDATKDPIKIEVVVKVLVNPRKREFIERTLNLTIMDLDTYNKKVKDHQAGALDFKSTEALQKYYLETEF